MHDAYAAALPGILIPYESVAVRHLNETAAKVRRDRSMLEDIGRAVAPRQYLRISHDGSYFAMLDFRIKDAEVQIRVPWGILKSPIEVVSNKELPERVVDSFCYRLAQKWLDYQTRAGSRQY